MEPKEGLRMGLKRSLTQFNGERDGVKLVFSTNGFGITGYPHFCKRIKFIPSSHLHKSGSQI